MIERPAPAGAGIAQAGAEPSEAAEAAPVLQINAAPEAEGMSHVLAVSGPDPALAPQAPPKLADRRSPRFESTTSRPTRRASRAAAGMEGVTYRAVFACCTEATDTPIK
jgi:hypothetical protein